MFTSPVYQQETNPDTVSNDLLVNDETANRIMDVLPNSNSFEVVEEPVDEYNRYIPGTIVLSETGKNIKRYIKYKGLTQFLIDGYDAFLDNDFSKRLNSKTLNVRGSQVHVKFFGWELPTIDGINPMYPKDAIHSVKDYTLKPRVYLEMSHYNQQQQQMTSVQSTNFTLGEIPLMVGSKRCYLHGKSVEDKIKLGIPPSDPCGYFIMKGVERVLLLQEQLRTGKLNLISVKGDVICRVMGMTDRGSHQAAISIGKNDVINYKMTSFCSKQDDPLSQQLPVMRLFRYFGYTKEQSWDFIKRFIPAEHHKRCEFLMINSKLSMDSDAVRDKLSNHIQVITSIGGHQVYILDPNYQRYTRFCKIEGQSYDVQLAIYPEQANIGGYIYPPNTLYYWVNPHPEVYIELTDINYISDRMYRTNQPTNTRKKASNIYLCKTISSNDEGNKLQLEISAPQNKILRVEEAIENDIFPYMGRVVNQDGSVNTEILERKMNMLGAMIAKRLLYEIGKVNLDDMDHWGNKKLETAGKMMDQLFRTIYRLAMINVQKYIDTGRLDGSPENILETIKNKLQEAGRKIQEVFSKSFTTSTWGVNGKIKKTNAVAELKRDNLLSALSHLHRVIVSIERNDKQASIRLVQNSQYGYICVVETPESDTCGIVKNLALTCYITIDIDDTSIINTILRTNGYVSSSPNETQGFMTPIFVNGKFICWGNGEWWKQTLINARRSRMIHEMTCIVLSKVDGALYVLTDASRCVRPLLIVNDDGTRLKIDEIEGGRRMTFQELLNNGYAEFIDAWEQEGIKLASKESDINMFNGEIADVRKELQTALALELEAQGGNAYKEVFQNGKIANVEVTLDEARFSREMVEKKLDMLLKRRKYTHCEMTPTSILGVTAALIPKLEHNQGPRNTFQAAMGKQAVGIYHDFHSQRYDGTVRTLAYPSRPFFEPQLSSILDPLGMPQGQMVIVAFMSFTGFNQEDAFIFNKASIEQGKFSVIKYYNYKVDVKTSSGEKLGRPNVRSLKYRHIDDSGLPIVGSFLRQGDCVVGKIRQDGSNASEHVRIGEQGYVDSIKVNKDETTTKVVVKMRIMRVPKEGDKFAPRNAQKGTIGLILPPEFMPETDSGVRPDIIANPHCIVSRMTMEYLLEILAGKYTAITGERVDGTPFEPFDMNACREALKSRGFNEYGYEKMKDGLTGRRINAQIYMGPVYFQRLKHDVDDKFQARQQGPINPTLGQPNKGKKLMGGLRVGEQERDTCIAHGASAVLVERLRDASDPYRSVFCKKCGTEARADKEIQSYVCKMCGTDAEFGTCTIPKAFKLVQNIMMVMGIGMPFGFGTREEYRAKKSSAVVDIPHPLGNVTGGVQNGDVEDPLDPNVADDEEEDEEAVEEEEEAVEDDADNEENDDDIASMVYNS